MKPKFDTEEEYWRWFEKKREEQILNEYFGEIRKEENDSH